MKVLFLVQKEQRVILDRLYDAVCDNVSWCDLRWLSSNEQANLKDYFRHIDVTAYDRIILFLRFKKEIRQVRFIRTIPNLVILEHDAYQNFIPGKYQGKFLAHYQQLSGVRVISSGFGVTRKLRAHGVDAVFVPKGYDQTLLCNLSRPRDIDLGFVGSIESRVYSERKKLLQALNREESLKITRTRSGKEYLDRLNRINIFVSADIGMGEYMIKNFEAMACGCALCAYDQGYEENEALGFIDLQNIILYRNLSELREKLATVRADNSLLTAIMQAGQKLVEKRFRFDLLGKMIANALVPPLDPRPIKK